METQKVIAMMSAIIYAGHLSKGAAVSEEHCVTVARRLYWWMEQQPASSQELPPL